MTTEGDNEIGKARRLVKNMGLMTAGVDEQGQAKVDLNLFSPQLLQAIIEADNNLIFAAVQARALLRGEEIVTGQEIWVAPIPAQKRG